MAGRPEREFRSPPATSIGENIMMNRKSFTAVALAALAMGPASQASAQACDTFDTLTIHLEVNATDADGEIVLLAKGQDDGLDRLRVWGPNNKKFLEFRGRKGGVGVREFILESAEPPDLSEVLASFPAGNYRVRGVTVADDCLEGIAALSHTQAPATQIVTPAPNEVLDAEDFIVSWAPVSGAAGYFLELVDENLGYVLKADLPPTQTQFDASGWVGDGGEYEVVVAVKAANGNVTGVALIAFTTTP
jgi:hypothetical protein